MILHNHLFFFLGTQISLAKLQSLLSEMEGRNEAQAANIESLTATLNTKDDIINVIFLLVTQLHIMPSQIRNVPISF